MAITEEEKQLREACSASWRTATDEARRRGLARRRQQRLWQDAVAMSLDEAAQRSWEEEMQNSELEAATMLSAYEEARQRRSRLVALDNKLFDSTPLRGQQDLQGKILARARWQRALDMVKVCKACCDASGTEAWTVYFTMDEIN